MQHAAEPLDQRIGELALEEGGKIGPLRTAGADRADERALQSLCETPHLPRLGLDLIGGDVDLHMQRRADAATERLGLIAFEQEVSVQRRNVGEPGIIEGAAVDEMEVGVEDARIGHRIRLAGLKRRAQK